MRYLSPWRSYTNPYLLMHSGRFQTPPINAFQTLASPLRDPVQGLHTAMGGQVAKGHALEAEGGLPHGPVNGWLLGGLCRLVSDPRSRWLLPQTGR